MGESEDRLRAIFELTLDAMVTMDENGVIRDWNPAAERIFGWSKDEAIGQAASSLILPPQYREAHERGLAVYRETGKGPVLGKVLDHLNGLHRDGYEFPVELAISPAGQVGGQTVFVGVIRDITGRRRAQELQLARIGVTQALAANNTWADASGPLLQSLCQSMSWFLGEVWLVDAEGTKLRWNACWQSAEDDMPGFAEESRSLALAQGVGLPGKVWATAGPISVLDIADDSDFQRSSLASQEGVHSAMAFPIVGGDKVYGVICVYCQEVRNLGPEMLNVMADIGSQIGQFLGREEVEASLEAALRTEADERIKSEAERRAALEEQAFTDRVTGLPNRGVFDDRLGLAVRLAKREKTKFSLMIVDLDGFKAVNDTHGHRVGDHLLRELATRLSESIRESDTVARIGGDEFGVILPGLDDDRIAVRLAEKILASIKRPVAVQKKTISVGASVGIACFPRHSSDPETLFGQADRAMYAAKRTRRGWSIHGRDSR